MNQSPEPQHEPTKAPADADFLWQTITTEPGTAVLGVHVDGEILYANDAAATKLCGPEARGP